MIRDAGLRAYERALPFQSPLYGSRMRRNMSEMTVRVGAPFFPG